MSAELNSMSVAPNDIRDNQHRPADPLFHEMPFIRPLSRFISEYEQSVMEVLLKEGLPFIYIADNGFRDYYKPQDSLFDAVARKQVLILSPWEYDPKMTRVSRDRCVQMNKMAEEICSIS